MRAILQPGAVARFLISGGSATLFNLFLLWILIDKIRVWYMSAAVISYSLCIGYNFALQRAWAFKGSRGSAVKQFPQFALTNIAGLAINTALIFSFVRSFGISPLLSQIAASAIVSVFSFLAYLRIFARGVELPRTGL